MKRVIVLPNGKAVSLACYTARWKAVKAAPADAEIRGWDHFPTPAADVLRELRFGMHDRVNRRDPAYGVGRKWDADWQRETAHAARALNQPRLAIHWLPAWLKPRFGRRLEAA